MPKGGGKYNYKTNAKWQMQSFFKKNKFIEKEN